MQGVAGRPTWAQIDLGALRANWDALRARAVGRELFAVLKADAYGHGAVTVARALAELGCRGLAVALLEEALELRAAGVTVPLLLLQGLHDPAQADAALAAGLSCALVHAHGLAPLAAAGARAGRRFPLHLKVDTGLGRLGVLPEELDALLEALAASPWVELEGVMTHLAHADDTLHPVNDEQRRRFAAALARVRERGFAPRWRHADASAGLFQGLTPDTNAVRPGLALFGPDPTREGGHGGEPVMSLHTRVLSVREVPAGARVGYGGTYTAAKATRLAVLPLGYADGLPRAAGNRFAVGIGGQRVPLVGRVSMDAAVADVAELPVRAGDPALIFGRAGGLQIRVEELAQALGAIPYEVLVGISRRVPRRVLGAAEPAGGEPPAGRVPTPAGGRAGGD